MRIRRHKKFLKDFRDTKLRPESKDHALGGNTLIIYIESAIDEVILELNSYKLILIMNK